MIKVGNYSISTDVPGRSHTVMHKGSRVGVISSYEIPGSNVPTKANPQAKSRFKKYSVSIDGKTKEGKHANIYNAHDFESPEAALKHFASKHKEIHENVTTGPAISGTQSAEDDPSTPLAKRLFATKMAKRKAIESIKEQIDEAKKIDTRALTFMSPRQKQNYIDSVKSINAATPAKPKIRVIKKPAAAPAQPAPAPQAATPAPQAAPTPAKYIPKSFESHIDSFHATGDHSHLDRAESLANSEYSREKLRNVGLEGHKRHANMRFVNDLFDTRMSEINRLRGKSAPAPQKQSRLKRLADIIRGK